MGLLSHCVGFLMMCSKVCEAHTQWVVNTLCWLFNGV